MLRAVEDCERAREAVRWRFEHAESTGVSARVRRLLHTPGERVEPGGLTQAVLARSCSPRLM